MHSCINLLKPTKTNGDMALIDLGMHWFLHSVADYEIFYGLPYEITAQGHL